MYKYTHMYIKINSAHCTHDLVVFFLFSLFPFFFSFIFARLPFGLFVLYGTRAGAATMHPPLYIYQTVFNETSTVYILYMYKYGTRRAGTRPDAGMDWSRCYILTYIYIRIKRSWE